jgi:hypothetical protein
MTRVAIALIKDAPAGNGFEYDGRRQDIVAGRLSHLYPDGNRQRRGVDASLVRSPR